MPTICNSLQTEPPNTSARQGAHFVFFGMCRLTHPWSSQAVNHKTFPCEWTRQAQRVIMHTFEKEAQVPQDLQFGSACSTMRYPGIGWDSMGVHSNMFATWALSPVGSFSEEGIQKPTHVSKLSSLRRGGDKTSSSRNGVHCDACGLRFCVMRW